MKVEREKFEFSQFKMEDDRYLKIVIYLFCHYFNTCHQILIKACVL